MSLRPVLGLRGAALVPAAHLLSDESAAMAIARGTPRERRVAYWVTGSVVFLFWNLATLAGALSGSLLADPESPRVRHGFLGRVPGAGGPPAAGAGRAAGLRDGGGGGRGRGPLRRFGSAGALAAGLTALGVALLPPAEAGGGRRRANTTGRRDAA
ncbi:AzlC family ABC transporter permease [Streptomyces sp. UH6]|uniref:AzlC family ABC transporter permease n=1 Tax=Streptomyces sp. UH6 TaxID=2748379 RepID=UPI0015D4EBBE|nr:AzlC family ABC transporter permease [Streptomyces sp. UH6]NYV72876.1 AzlC family ABC transporter permease [Streptomyces sp. UH6]